MENTSLTLKRRAISSGTWVLAGYGMSQVLRLVSNLIMTRLLVPEMFGIMAIVTIFINGVGMFSDIGLQQNIIQSKRGDDKSFRNTAWSIQIIRGVAIFFILIMISVALYVLDHAGLIGGQRVYADPRLPALLAVTSLSVLFSGFNSINWLALNRQLLMKKIVFIEFLSQLISVAAMIGIAWFTRDIWALVIGNLVSVILKLILSHNKTLGPSSKFEWDKSCVNEIVHFGKWIFISSILGFLLAQGDRILLGMWLTPEKLGIYTIAFFLANSLKGALKKLVSSVFFSVLSEIARNRPNELKRVYYQIRRKVDFITMTLAGLMASCGHLIVQFLYDARYHQAGWMFEILSISMVFVGYSLAGSCLMAMGNAKSNMQLTLVATIFLYIGVPIAFIFYGFHGAVVMIALNYIIDIPSTFYMMKKANMLNIKYELYMLPLFFIAYGFGHAVDIYIH